ncbi:MAG: hypothetical protein HUK02_06260, partial [Bacteroidaceae bacterium]|nr:hypothetical protein [Bacteroidaceae bacterium]
TKGYNGYSVPLTGTAAVVVESHEKVRNDKATLQINDLAKLSMVYMQYADGTNIVHSYMGPTPELEQTFMFDANGDNPFSLYFSPLDYENPGCVTVNGEVVAPTYEKGTSYQLQLKDGDVVKVWAGETPSADDSYSITVNVDAADRLFYVDYDEATYEWAKVSMKAGKNVIKFKEDTYLPINVEDGFGVSSFTCVTTGQPIEEFYGSFPLELTPAMDGYEYNVVTFNEDDFRTGEMSVWVDDASNVDIYYEGSGKKATALTNGDNIFKYNPETESTIRICSKDYFKSLYKVLVNGERVEPSYGEFYVTCDPANKVEIFATFPDVTVPVTFSFANEGTEGAIREVTVNGEAVADYSNFTVKMGDQLGIDLNTTDYNITSLTKNGQEQEDFQYGWSSVVTDEELNFVVTAKPWGNVAFTITINDPKAVTIYKGEMWNDDKFTDLVAGENKVEMPASLSMITIQANSAAVINSVTKNGELQDGGMGYFVEIAEGDQIVIDAKSAERTAKAIVWVDDVTKANLLCGMGRADDTPFDDVDGILQSGENVVMFDASIDNPFYLTFAGDDLNEGDVKVFINDSSESLVPMFNNYFPDITLADGDYIRVYLNEIPDAITSVGSTTETTAAYNLAGQRVTKAYKGLVIKNGKKFVVK